MSAHIKVFIPEDQRWVSWCQAPTRITEGLTAEEVRNLRYLAGKEGLQLLCAYQTPELASAVVTFLHKQRPHIQYKAVDGPCDQRDCYEFEDFR